MPLFAQWQHPQSIEAVAALIAAWDQTCYAEILVAEVGAALGGMAAVSAAPHLSRRGRYGRLAGLVVDRAHRRLGIGAALLRAAEERARAWGCDQMEVTSARSREEAHAFYPAQGYEEASGHHARYLRPL